MAADISFLNLDIPTELETKVIEIPNKRQTQVVKPDLENNTKRWLVVSICLHSIISPALRRYISPLVSTLYNSLKQTNNIDAQTYQKCLKNYPTNGYRLNYEAINNNKQNSGRDDRKYDYRIQSDVDLTKLFLPTHMTQYTGFDESCDSSALLGIIINIDDMNIFSKVVESLAKQVRSEIRNPWAHCNFQEWESNQYLRSMQLMYQFIKALHLNQGDEAKTLADLSLWKSNGVQFLAGSTIGLELLGEIKKDTEALAKYVLKVKSTAEDSFKKVYDSLLQISNEIIVNEGRTNQAFNTHNDQMEVVNQKIETLNIKVAETQRAQTHSDVKFERLHGKYTQESSLIYCRIKCVEKQNTKVKEDIQDIKYKIERIERYIEYHKPQGKTCFYLPDRIDCFVGRKEELNEMELAFSTNRNMHHTHVICGLGGCGKTTLANEFGWLFHHFYPDGIFWASAESTESVEDTIATIAIDVGTTGSDEKETLKRTLKWLSSLPQRWLLIVDNVDADCISGNMKEVLLGVWKRNSKGHIIITTRREPEAVEDSINIKSENCIYLQVLNNDEGVDFMKQRTGICDIAIEHDAIYTLVRELGGLPLALEQAAAHIKSIRCSFTDYLQRFNEKRIKLLRATSSKYYFETNTDRLAVLTTWKLNIEYIHNQSEKEDLGKIPVFIMEIASYLYADDIPIDIINSGEPALDDKLLREPLTNSVCIKQAIEILCRFSLFQRNGTDGLTVHRLVQEVIRNNIDNLEDRKSIMLCATRMMNRALHLTESPNMALSSARKGVISRGSLRMWSRLAANANALKSHLMELLKESSVSKDFVLNKETIRLMQTTAIYNSLHQRNDKALEDQDQMLKIMTKLDLTENECKEVMSLKVPLLERDRFHIQDSIASLLEDDTNDENKLSLQPLPVDTLRELGNKAFKEERYSNALQCYTEAIRGSDIKNIDSKLLSNRSLVYLKIGEYDKALKDANKCIDQDPKNWKGYVWKAYAIAQLIEKSELSPEMEGIGLASACIAAHLNEGCQLEYKMKIYYPLLCFKTVDISAYLEQEIASLYDRPFTTIMLTRGCYVFQQLVITTKSIQVIGIDDGVEIDVGPGMGICRPVISNFEPEPQIYVHFENVSFTNGGQIMVFDNGIASFYRCKFSNGITNNDNILNKGGIKSLDKTDNDLAGLSVLQAGKLIVHYCKLNTGIIVDKEGSFLEIENSEILNTIGSGIVAENGANIKVINNRIRGNRTNGIVLGPRGKGDIVKNYITENNGEGIWCRGVTRKNHEKNMSNVSDNGSKAHILDNVICHNGSCGMLFDGGWYDIGRNEIYSNWLWGIAIQNRTSIDITDNKISSNKCGGIRIGTNFSASVVIDGNTIRDHSGPPIYSVNPNVKVRQPSDITPSNIEEEIQYSLQSIVTSRNHFLNNNKPIQNPQDAIKLLEACSFCTETLERLKWCSKCKIAKYCSKECQRRHWDRHKNLCTLLNKAYIIQIDMNDTAINKDFAHRHFLSTQKGLFEGPAPDRKSFNRFIVKIQSDHSYGPCDPNKYLIMYDRSVKLDITFVNPELYYLCSECGILAGTKFCAKTLFCWASFKEHGKILCIHTEKLPPVQEW